MADWDKAFTTKPEYLILISRTHEVEGENQFLRAIL